MAYKFYIDGQLTDEPTNDTDLNSTIKRDRQLNNLLVTQDVELEWNGNNNPPIGAISGYTYLKNLFDNSACNEAELKIYDELNDNTTILFYTGIIKIPSLKIDLQNVLLKTKVQDNSFYAYINNNKGIEVDLSADLTKSQLSTTPIQKYSVDMFNQLTCVYGSTNGAYYEAYLVYDVFDLIIRAISDNKIQFESEFLQNLEQKPFLCKGQDLLNSYTLYPSAQDTIIKLTFEKLFENIRKIYNVFFWIEYDAGNNPILKLESFDNSYNQDISYSFDDIKKLEVSIDSTTLYGLVNVGSDKISGGTFNNGLSYYGWQREQFFPLGQCNIDTDLDLVNDFVIDTNSIQDILIGQTSDLIDDIFLIECDNVDEINKTATAYQWELANDGNCWYNLGMNNFNKVQRYSDQFLTTFGNFNGLGGYGFHASLGNIISFSTDAAYGNVVTPTNVPNGPPPIITTYSPVVFGDETSPGNYDNGGNYNNLNGRYILPADGIYNFVWGIDYSAFGFEISGPNRRYSYQIRWKVGVYDSSNTLLYEQYYPTSPFNPSINPGFSGSYTNTYTFLINGNATDYVMCSLDIVIYNNTNFNVNIIPYINILNSYFTVIATPGYQGGGGAGNNNANKYLYEFDYDINQTDYMTILNNVTKKLEFEKDGVTRIGWIESIKRNDWNGLSKIKLISKNASITQ